MEAQFDSEGVEHRKRVGHISLLAGIIIFNAFLLADQKILPDVFGWLAFVRLGIFTPVCLLILWILPRTSTTLQIDTMAVAGTVLAVLLPTATMVFSQSHYVLIYQFASMITITYFTLVQRVRVRMAAIGLVIVVAVQLSCVSLRPEIDGPSFAFVVDFYLAGSALLLMGAYIQERVERQAFLEHLRSELLIEHIEWTARTDLLTGLSNRHHLAQLREQLATAPAMEPIAAMMIDIDHFKTFNDTQGHLAGDHCIQTVAKAILAALEEADPGDAARGHAFRFGGEEFLLLLIGWDNARAVELGTAVRRHLQTARIPHPATGEGACVTASIGVATCEGDRYDIDDLIGRADAALYRAKQDGRDRLRLAA
ncbi:GGDEF domain-containing protein [Sphingomonas sp.]|uniref:GGDEF domain-containing protein n=1 Tax=Sphingomonas sp. TaxID=28214 RepID=UPI0031E19981